MARLNEEDPTFTFVNNGETHQMVLSGTGDMQMDVLVSKLKSRFNVEAELKAPRWPIVRRSARQSPNRAATKQTGGAGQFGDVWVRFEPNPESDQMVFAEGGFRRLRAQELFPCCGEGPA